ncbi:unnamed protein product [Calicophoron daubneyi]|uniref:Uncharacterized protein n=1 Tax=Calicophoron daubneyi TaxID=300641 RepID=A0AAV2TLP2_CALDB
MDEDFYDYSSDEEVIEFRRKNEEAKKARERARKQLLEEPDELDTSRIRQLARNATNRVQDEYDEIRSRAQEKDKETLDYIDTILNQTSLNYGNQRKATVPLVTRMRCDTKSSRQRPDSSQNEKMNQLQEDKLLSELRYTSMPPASAKTARERVQRIEERLNGILDYELPSAENFKNMRSSLREINDKMTTHKLLLDRRSNSATEDDGRKVSERIEEKYRQLEERMPYLAAGGRTRSQYHSSGFDPVLIPGYSTGLSIPNWDQNAELRGRIRMLLCRTRRTSAASGVGHVPSSQRQPEQSTKA